jgi:hypothetical protein
MADRDKTWQEIRALRASPPTRVAQDQDRRAVFGAALRQAQELADASAASGYATRPLPLFYCFSQGLRAVSAVHVDDDAWRIRGHGAKVITKTPLLETSVVPKPSNPSGTRDALSALQLLAGGDRATAPMTLGALWAAFPDAPGLPDAVVDAPRALTARLPPGSLASQHAASGRIELAVEGLSTAWSDAELRKKLTAYPSFAGATPARQLMSEETMSAYRTDTPQVRFRGGNLVLPMTERWLDTSPVLTWPIDGNDIAAYHETYARIAPTAIEGDNKARMALPSLGGVDAPDFIVIWWSLLLGLSSIVRYEPALWIGAIEPDTSALAVPLEQVCDFGEIFVPGMLLFMLSASHLPE